MLAIADVKPTKAERKARNAQSRRDKDKASQLSLSNNDKPEMPNAYHMSPHVYSMIPTLLRSGQAFAYTGVIKVELSQAIGETILIMSTNPGSAGTVALIGRQTGIAAPAYSVATIPNLSLSDEVGGPTSTRAMKFGVSLTTTTPLLSRGTRIHHLNGQSRIRIDQPPSTLSLAVFQSIVNVVTGMPTAVPYDNTHFGETREFTSNVVDNVAYIDFQNFEGTLTVDQIAAHMAVWPGLAGGLRDRPMSTTWLVLAPPPVAQSYHLAFHGAYYTRWGLSTVQGQSQTNIPTASADIINKIHEHADTMSYVAHSILDVGQRIGETILPLVADRAGRYMAGQLALAA